MKRLGLLLLVGLTAPAAAQGPGKDVPLEIKGGNVTTVPVEKTVIVRTDATLVNSFPFTVSAVHDPLALYFWTYPLGVQAADQGSTLKVTAGTKGETTISVKIVTPKLDAAGKFLGYNTQFGSTTFYVGEVTPGPTPPDPKPPDPKPPDPKPTPKEGPLRVVMVRESATPLSRAHDVVWNSTKLVTYLNAKCVKDVTTNRPEYRKWDKDVVLTKETPTMTKLWEDIKPQLAGQTLPVIVIVVGQSGKVHPLPESEQGVIDLIQQATGQSTSTRRSDVTVEQAKRLAAGDRVQSAGRSGTVTRSGVNSSGDHTLNVTWDEPPGIEYTKYSYYSTGQTLRHYLRRLHKGAA